MVRKNVANVGIVAAASLALILTGCAGDGTESGAPLAEEQVLVVGQVGDMVGFEPIRTPLANLSYLQQVHEFMTENLRNEGDPEPRGIAALEMNDDFTEATLTVREGLTTHAGNVVDAVMIADYFNERVLVKETGGAMFARLANVDQVVAEGESVVRFTFSAPTPQFPGLLQTIPIVDYPRTFLAEDGTTVLGFNEETDIVSTGPFQLVDYIPNDRMLLEKFPEYWDAENVTLDQIEIRYFGDATSLIAALEAGDIDLAFNITASDASRLKQNSEFKVYEPQTGAVMHVLFANPKAPGLGDPKVRQAIDLAINRDDLNAVAFDGLAKPVTQCYSEASGAHVDALDRDTSGDIAAAKKLLEGVALPSTPLRLPVLADDGMNLAMAEVVQANLAEIGVPVEIIPLDAAARAKVLGDIDYDLLISLMTAPTKYPGLLWDTRFFLPTGNPLIDDLDDEYANAYRGAYAEASTLTGEDALKVWREANEALSGGAWMNCLMSAPFLMASSSKVEGVTWNHGDWPVFRDVRITQ